MRVCERLTLNRTVISVEHRCWLITWFTKGFLIYIVITKKNITFKDKGWSFFTITLAFLYKQYFLTLQQRRFSVTIVCSCIQHLYLGRSWTKFSPSYLSRTHGIFVSLDNQKKKSWRLVCVSICIENPTEMVKYRHNLATWEWPQLREFFCPPQLTGRNLQSLVGISTLSPVVGSFYLENSVISFSYNFDFSHFLFWF